MGSSFPLANWRTKYKAKEKLACITAYDQMTALLATDSNADLILVGDSLSNVVQGNKTTVPLTIEELIYHTKIVVRNAPDRFIIADMPFGSFKVSYEQTVANSIRVVKESGCTGIKLEGAEDCDISAIKTLIQIGVPVFGHIGLLPQTVNQLGGFLIQGKTQVDCDSLITKAKLLEEAGVFGIVLECVEAKTAQKITSAINIPTIGIGSGTEVDGQILVLHDLLGMLPNTPPSFVKPTANLFADGLSGLKGWIKTVKKQ